MKVAPAQRSLAALVTSMALSFVLVGCEGDTKPLPPVTPSPVPYPDESKTDAKAKEAAKAPEKPETKSDTKEATKADVPAGGTAKEAPKGDLPALTPPTDAAKPK